MSKHKLCKDCKHVVYKPNIYGDNPLCGRFVDYATGEKVGRCLASSEREHDWLMCLMYGYCGRNARHFQPKDNNE